MAEVEILSDISQVEHISHADRDVSACSLLEKGQVLYFPRLVFPLIAREPRLLSPDIVTGTRKNVSFNPVSGVLRGVHDMPDLQHMMKRFSTYARELVIRVLPNYRQVMEWGLTSYRPVEIAGRTTSWRKDDTRLHVDAFPSRPTQGRRILRVFANLGPKPRVWRLGEPFPAVVDHFAASLRLPVPGSAWLLQHLRIIKGRRSPYDHLMLQLHDSMKADLNYQVKAVREQFLFPPGATWMVFTDQVSHAATAGQFALEQTFFIPVSALERPADSPLRILETRLRRALC